jgi:hypothetical protein
VFCFQNNEIPQLRPAPLSLRRPAFGMTGQRLGSGSGVSRLSVLFGFVLRRHMKGVREWSSCATNFAQKRDNTIAKVNSRLPPCGGRFAGGRDGVGPKGLGVHLLLVAKVTTLFFCRGRSRRISLFSEHTNQRLQV